MDMPHNHFKQGLAENRLQLGLFLGLASTLSAEILAACGFDFLLIDAEHSPNDLPSVLAQLQAMAAYPVSVMVRPASHDPVLIRQLLGVGAQTLLIPMVESAQQARALVAAVRYPPRGIRGVGTALERSARWNHVADYFAQTEAQTCLLLQIESCEGVKNLDEILQVDGVDGLFIGPADLAASMGYLNQPAHPEVQAVIEQALGKLRGAAKAAGIFSTDPQLLKKYQASGVRFLAVGADTQILRNAAVNLRQGFSSKAA